MTIKTWTVMALVCVGGFSATALADNPDVCNRGAADVQKLAYEGSARMGVYNHGGLLGDGVCWWHSRFQRSALYLASFRPDLPKPTQAQAVSIINALANMNRVVVIPGYGDFNQFSSEYGSEIISRLEAWQRSDGFLHFRWVDGLKGHWRLPAKTLESIVGRIHEMVSVEHRIVFEKLHFNSIATHAYLVIGSRQTEQGYDLDVIDSNAPDQTLTVSYQRGETSLTEPYGNQLFIPYLDYDGDMGKINSVLRRTCGHSPAAAAELP